MAVGMSGVSGVHAVNLMFFFLSCGIAAIVGPPSTTNDGKGGMPSQLGYMECWLCPGRDPVAWGCVKLTACTLLTSHIPTVVLHFFCP